MNEIVERKRIFITTTRRPWPTIVVWLGHRTLCNFLAVRLDSAPWSTLAQFSFPLTFLLAFHVNLTRININAKWKKFTSKAGHVSGHWPMRRSGRSTLIGRV